MAQRTDHHMLEEENDKMVDHLSSKVQALKSVIYTMYLVPKSCQVNIIELLLEETVINWVSEFFV